MSLLTRVFRPVARTSSVRQARRVVGRLGAPGLNPEIELLHRRITDTDNGAAQQVRRVEARLDALEEQARQLSARMTSMDRHMPAVLNAIASTNGTARLLRRETDELSDRLSRDEGRVEEALDRLAADIGTLFGHVRDELWPLQAKSAGLDGLYATSEWLVKRIETVRAEVMHELRYGAANTGDAVPSIAPRVVNPAVLSDADDAPRLNLGCGHLPLDGYVNVDIRELPGVDVVAAVDDLPFERGTVGEIFSAHVLEHFPQAALQRQLLPYWRSLLAPGGTFRAVVPDIAAMIDQYRGGEITFDALRSVAYGGQEYDGDFHHTAFTPESLSEILAEAGFEDVEVVTQGRVNGDCLEFEVVARRPG